jgi:hypothetical protein
MACSSPFTLPSYWPVVNQKPYHRSVFWEKQLYSVKLAKLVFKTEGNCADKERQENTMIFHIGFNVKGELCARSEARCIRVWRLSELMGDGVPEDQLKGRGYCSLKEKFPGCNIKGDEKCEDILYTTTIG